MQPFIHADIVVPEGAEALYGDEPCIRDNDMADPVERERYRLFYLQGRASGMSESEADMAAADNLASEQADPDELIEDGIRVSWSADGEGYNGYYDEEDPDDVELLRFNVAIHADLLRANPERMYNVWGWGRITVEDAIAAYPTQWIPVEGGSNCSEFAASATPAQRLAGLQVLLKEFKQPLLDGDSIKGRAEFMAGLCIRDLLPAVA